MKLTQKSAAALKLPHGKDDHIEWDDDLAGFGIRLRRSGNGRVRKSWVVQYRPKGKAKQRRSSYDFEKVTAEQARTQAKQELAEVTIGRDPKGERETERQKGSRTLIATANAFLEMKELEMQRGEYRASSYRVTKLYLTGKDYFGPLHKMLLTDIAVSDIALRINAINKNSGTVTASRARAALRSMYVWAMQQGFMGANPHNPVAATRNPGGAQSRDLVLTDRELAEVYRAAGDDNFGKAVKLLILTGCRREEIAGLKWSEIDRDAATITLPKERTKNRHELVLPLTPMAMAIVDSVPQVIGRDHLFGPRSATGLTGFDAAKKALDGRLVGKLKGKSATWRLHDLRRSLATWLGEHDVEPWTIESILNHWSGSRRGIVSVYNRAKHQKQMRVALSLWDDHLRTLIESGGRKILSFPQTARETARENS
jgi:integrase